VSRLSGTRAPSAMLLCAALVGFCASGVSAEPLATSTARIQVQPHTAEVYVDGYLVGTVDSFDGFLQRLEVPAGEHELILYLEGYKTVRQKMLFAPETAVAIKYQLRPLASGEAQEPRPEPPKHDPSPAASPFEGSWFDEPPAAAPAAMHPTSEFGRLAVRVQPAGATILVDGQKWTPPEDGDPITIDLHEGTHEIEIESEGLSTFRKSVRVRAGETVSLNVSLVR